MLLPSVYDRDHIRELRLHSSVGNWKHRTRIADAMDSKPVGASEFVLDFICNCEDLFHFYGKCVSGKHGISYEKAKTSDRIRNNRSWTLFTFKNLLLQSTDVSILCSCITGEYKLCCFWPWSWLVFNFSLSILYISKSEPVKALRVNINT